MTAAPMTKRDRTELAQVAKMRARVAKASIEQREMVLRSQVENELEALFDTEMELAQKATAIAIAEAKRADIDLQERLVEYGIPEKLRPRLTAEFVQRQMQFKEQSVAARRGALRQIASARIKALGALAKVEIDRACADTVEQLIAGGLDSESAQHYLDRMPTIDQLMLAPSVAELEAVHDDQRQQRRELGGAF